MRFPKWVKWTFKGLAGTVLLLFIGLATFLFLLASPSDLDEILVDDDHRIALFAVSNWDLNYDMYYEVYRSSREIFRSETFFCSHVYGENAEEYQAYSTPSGIVGIYSSASPQIIVGIMDLKANRFPSRHQHDEAEELLKVLEFNLHKELRLDSFYYPR